MASRRNAIKAPLFGLFLLAACVARPPAPPEKAVFEPVAFAELKGWNDDRQSEALGALLRSCPALEGKPGWANICPELKRLSAAKDDAAARAFFEKEFQAYAVKGREGAEGLFTGYYEPELNGAWERGGKYQTPLWERPDDLITVDLGEFKPELKGQKIAGKIVGQKLKLYDDRAKVAGGSLEGRARPLLWVDDPVDGFFLEIQGSGKVCLEDGSMLRVGFSAQNGRGYVPIGKVLGDAGEIEKPVTMQKIRAWLAAHPARAREVMNQNPSVVFFRRAEDGPIGAAGVTLTPHRSLAVDRKFIPLNRPLWFEPLEKDIAPRLVVAQDTGGAIKGIVRGDLFWGAGREAAERAGNMQARGRYYLLLPRGAEKP